MNGEDVPRTSPSNHGTLQTVQAGRGIAATLVVLFHAGSSIFPATKYWHREVAGGVFGFGYAGVEFFFVLSGFIIAFAHWSDLDRPSRLGNFVRRRFVRIYPLYWLVLAGIFVVTVYGIGTPLPPAPTIVSSILLVGDDYSRTILGVAWTLYHEIGFYLVFALAIWRPWLGVVLGGAAIVAAACRAVGITLPLPFYWQAPVNLLFPMGIIAWHSSRGRWRGGRWLALGGCLAFIALGLEAVYVRALSETALQLLFGLASALALSGAVTWERARPVAVPRLFRFFGAASYSIYLVHFPLLSALAQIAVHFNLISRSSTLVDFVVVVVLTLGLGGAVHRFVERPLLRLLASRRSLRPQDRLSAHVPPAI